MDAVTLEWELLLLIMEVVMVVMEDMEVTILGVSLKLEFRITHLTCSNEIQLMIT
jgi:hypothetical protein